MFQRTSPVISQSVSFVAVPPRSLPPPSQRTAPLPSVHTSTLTSLLEADATSCAISWNYIRHQTTRGGEESVLRLNRSV
jgi:hypothetical protein